jgi:hypothetical protein
LESLKKTAKFDPVLEELNGIPFSKVLLVMDVLWARHKSEMFSLRQEQEHHALLKSEHVSNKSIESEQQEHHALLKSEHTKSSVYRFHPFGCKAFPYVDRSDSKMQSLSKYGIYCGNAAAHNMHIMQCHKIWVQSKRKFVLTNHVQFHDLEFSRLADKLKIAEACGFPNSTANSSSPGVGDNIFQLAMF